MRLQNLDLNPLCALQALLDEQHVARAAERLGMSQPFYGAAGAPVNPVAVK